LLATHAHSLHLVAIKKYYYFKFISTNRVKIHSSDSWNNEEIRNSKNIINMVYILQIITSKISIILRLVTPNKKIVLKLYYYK